MIDSSDYTHPLRQMNYTKQVGDKTYYGNSSWIFQKSVNTNISLIPFSSANFKN